MHEYILVVRPGGGEWTVTLKLQSNGKVGYQNIGSHSTIEGALRRAGRYLDSREWLEDWLKFKKEAHK
jgi:hypothetical protein